MKCLFIKIICIGTLVTCKENLLRNFITVLGGIIRNVSSQNDILASEHGYIDKNQLTVAQGTDNRKESNEESLIDILDDIQNMDKDSKSRIKEDAICKQGRCGCGGPGRCGCNSPGRCGTSNTKNIDKLVDDINTQLEQDKIENEKDAQVQENIIVDQVNSKYKNSHDPNNNQLNTIIFDAFALDALLDSSLTRSSKYNKKEIDNEDPTNLLKAIVSEIYDINNAKSSEKQQLKRSKIPFAPKEIARFYNEFKDQATMRIFNYVKNLSPKKSLPYLTLKPRREFKKLKRRYREKKMSDDALGREIVDMLLGNKGNMRILPHKRCNMYEIIVPKWVYVAFYKMRQHHRQHHSY